MALLMGMMLAAAGFALLNKVLREGIWSPTNSMKRGPASRDQIIEIDEYEIVDDMNQASDGYRVKIQD